jgi:hypothetical protein
MQGSLARFRSIVILAMLFSMMGTVVPSAPAAHATAGWLTGWSYRKAITVSNAGMTATLTNFPLYVPLTSSNGGAGIASKVLDTGYDIRFTSSDGTTTLPYERESYSEASGNVTANFWVGVTLNGDNNAATDDTIYLYYGKADATDGQDTANGTNDVWDSNYEGVYHLGSSLTADSTSHAANGTNGGATANTGKVDGGAHFASDTNIALPAALARVHGTFTIEAFVQSTTIVAAEYHICTDWEWNEKNFLLEQNGNSIHALVGDGGTNQDAGLDGGTVSVGDWYQAVLTVDGTSQTLYFNGSSADAQTGSYSGGVSTKQRYFNGYNNTGNGVDGTMDEFRVSSVARSTAWIAFEYANITAAGNKLTFAAEEGTVDGWSYRKKITIDHTNVDADLSNYPLLVKINQDTDIGANAQSDGEDIRFTTSTGVLLPYERESWVVRAGSGSGNFWVKVPTISSSADTKIYLYYGNSGAPDLQDATNVWDANFKGVWHLAETGTNPTANDSTSNNNDSASQTWTPTVGGKIGGAGSFNGSSDAINITSNDGLNPASITVSAWVKADVNNKWQYAVLKNGQWDFGRDNGGKYYLAAWKTGNVNVADEHAATSATTGVWEHIAFTYDGSNAKYYVNTTVVINKGVSGDLFATANAVNIGSQAAGNYWDGLIDDVKISNVARSAAWLKFEYYNTGASDNETTWSLEQNGSTGLSSTTTTLASSNTSVTAGDSVTLTATVTSSTATGTVTFKNGATALGTATLGQGSGSLVVTNFAAGSHTLTAEYGGNVEFAASTSASITQTVAAAASSSSSSSTSSTASASHGGGGTGGGRRGSEEGMGNRIQNAYAAIFARFVASHPAPEEPSSAPAVVQE